MIAFGIGFIVGAFALLACGWALNRRYVNVLTEAHVKRIPHLDKQAEVRLFESMRSVAREMFAVPESLIENGLAVSFTGDDHPGFVVSVSRVGKKSFAELFLEKGAELDALRKRIGEQS